MFYFLIFSFSRYARAMIVVTENLLLLLYAYQHNLHRTQMILAIYRS